MSPTQIPRKHAANTKGVASNPAAVKAAPPTMAASSETKVMKKREPALANAILRDIAVMRGSGRCALSEISKRRRGHAEILRQRDFPQAADQRDQRIMMNGMRHRIHHFPPERG